MFYGKKRATHVAASLAAIALSALLAGCGKANTSAVFGYVSRDAQFKIGFPSRNKSVECEAVRADGRTSLRVVSPERSAELMVICSPNGCVITPKDGGEGIPLSSRAAEGLTDVFALLYRGSDGTESVARSDDGRFTVITYPDGAVTVGEDLLPSSVEIYSEDYVRVVTISDYEVSGAE